MTRYFLHLRDGTDEVLDPEGMELSGEDVSAVALLAARDCMAADVKAGKLNLRYRMMFTRQTATRCTA